MGSDKITAAIEFILNKRTGVAAAPFDDFQIALATFGSKVARWEGTEDINPDSGLPMSEYGWSAMPSLKNLNLAKLWISTNLDGGYTNVIAGLTHAFNSCNKKNEDLAGLKKAVSIDELTILVISDGDFYQDAKTLGRVLTRLQKERESKNLGKAIIGFVGIDVKLPKKGSKVEKTSYGLLSTLTKQHGALGFLRIVFIKPKEEDEEDDK